jgi:archaellum component FlaG (FlaF/FlaG flagellin family)
METSIPALLVAAILMITTVVMARSGYSSVDRISHSWQVMGQRLEEQVRTELSVVDTSVDPSYANITLRLRNDGQTVVADWARMDVVVQYFSESGTRYVRWMPYTSGALQSNTWTMVNIENDSFEPGVLNPGEVVQVLIRINPLMGTDTSAWVVVSTENGVTVSASVAG